MKKIKLISPILATTAAVAPLTMLATSCSKTDYTAATKTIKEDALKYFTTISSKGAFRQIFNCEEICKKIKEIMSTLGYTPIGEDDWSAVAWQDFHDHPTAGKDNPVHGTYGNIWYDIPATEGCEDWPKIIYSANYDMDYACSDDVLAEIKENGIPLHIDEEKQTIESVDHKCACGFNDGIGVSLLLSFAKNHKLISHGPVRLLFTADSVDSTPTYAGGALYLKHAQQTFGEGKKPFDTPFVFNTDGNKQSEIYVSSAGIHQCNFGRWAKADEGEWGQVDFTTEAYKNTPHKYKISVSGLTGGHTALDINKDRANAFKILFQLATFSNEGFRICDVTTDQRNPYKIPQSAEITFVTDAIMRNGVDATDTIMDYKIANTTEAFENAYPDEKGKIKITKEVQSVQKVRESGIYALSNTLSNNLSILCNLVRTGPFVWFDEQHEQVKTSSSIGPIDVTYNTARGFYINGSVTCRSADAIQLETFSADTHDYLKTLLNMTEAAGSVVDITTPVWENTLDKFKVENKMSNLVADGFKRFRFTPKEVNCHGCLEAVSIAHVIQNYYKEGQTTIPYIAAVGPTITSPQENNEKLFISTIDSCIRVFLYVLSNAQSLNKN